MYPSFELKLNTTLLSNYYYYYYRSGYFSGFVLRCSVATDDFWSGFNESESESISVWNRGIRPLGTTWWGLRSPNWIYPRKALMWAWVYFLKMVTAFWVLGENVCP